MLGRWLLGWFFISEALHRVRDWDAMVILVQLKHVPYGQPLLALAVVAMIFGGSMLFIGFQTRFSVLILALCTIASTGLAHDFWTIRNAAERASDYQDFVLGIAIIGGLLTIAAFGGGRFSIGRQEE